MEAEDLLRNSVVHVIEHGVAAGNNLTLSYTWKNRNCLSDG